MIGEIWRIVEDDIPIMTMRMKRSSKIDEIDTLNVTKKGSSSMGSCMPLPDGSAAICNVPKTCKVLFRSKSCISLFCLWLLPIMDCRIELFVLITIRKHKPSSHPLRRSVLVAK